jgi:hypothetical protein
VVVARLRTSDAGRRCRTMQPRSRLFYVSPILHTTLVALRDELHTRFLYRCLNMLHGK